jgi:hypothetical protein
VAGRKTVALSFFDSAAISLLDDAPGRNSAKSRGLVEKHESALRAFSADDECKPEGYTKIEKFTLEFVAQISWV